MRADSVALAIAVHVSLLVALGVPASASALRRIGPEVQLTSGSGGDKIFPSVAPTVDGGFLAVWEARGEIRARHFDHRNIPTGNEFTVSDGTICAEFPPSVASIPGGLVGVAWCSATTGYFSAAVAVLDRFGVRLGPPILLGDLWEGAPVVAAIDEGLFAVVWTGVGFSGQIAFVTSSGEHWFFPVAPLPPQLQLTVIPTSGSNADVLWYDSFRDILRRSFEPSGALSDEEAVAPVSSGLVLGPEACSSPSGNAVATWVTYSPDGNRPASYREFFPDGAAGVIRQATPSDPYPVHSYSTVACGSDLFAFVWRQARGEELPFVSYQGRFIPFGDNSPSASFAIGVNDAGRAQRPDVVHLTDGTMVVVWTDANESFTATEIFAQRFGFSPADASCAADCDGDGTVEINELVSAVTAALNSRRATELKRCLPADQNLDFRVSVDELIAGVSASLRGCG